MAQYSYNSYMSNKSSGNTSTQNKSQDYKVNYFKLRDFGDTALVKFPYTSTDQFEIVDVHTTKINGNFRKVSCLRTPNDDLATCPLCNSGEKVKSRFFARVISYVDDGNGGIKAQAGIWDRPVDFAEDLASLMAEFPNFANTLFKVKRMTKAGELKVNYQILPASPDVYKPEFYPLDTSGFTDFKLSPHSYLEKTAEEMVTYLQTGKFPERAKPVATQPAAPQVAPQVVPTQPVYAAPIQPVATQPIPVDDSLPVNTGGMTVHAYNQTFTPQVAIGAIPTGVASDPLPTFEQPVMPQFQQPTMASPVQPTRRYSYE